MDGREQKPLLQAGGETAAPPPEKPPRKPETKRQGRPGHALRAGGIKRQVILGFMAFTVVIVVLLWVFQIFLLNPFYRAIKTAEVKSMAETIEKHLEEDDLEDVLRQAMMASGVSVLITDEYGNQIVKAKESAVKKSQLDYFGRIDLNQIFEQVRVSGGSHLETFSTQLYNRDGTPSEVMIYAVTPQTATGQNRLLMLETEITPVDSTVDTLKVQLACLTVVMLLLGVVLAVVIARRISRPIVAINESAKSLGEGNYAIRFGEEGSREVRELAQTLNFAAEELSKVEELRKELLANVSHDLRTPLTMIKGYAEVMRDLPGENTPENVQIIVDEAERLTNLVNDLLDLSRLEAGVVPLDETRFNLTESIRAMLSRYDKLADYTFPFFADRDVWVVADELKISQVVYNLVNNAITYAGEDKTVTLRQTVYDGRVRVEVSDNGEGIPADKLKDIWERYYKVDKEHKRAQIGTGLGLSIVKNILDMHGGTYGVSSQLGEGSTFWFELLIHDGRVSHASQA